MKKKHREIGVVHEASNPCDFVGHGGPESGGQIVQIPAGLISSDAADTQDQSFPMVDQPFPMVDQPFPIVDDHLPH